MATKEMLCKLSRELAVCLIQDAATVQYKNGVWNQYKEQPVDYVSERIRNSGYGADVWLDYTTGTYYVCTPVTSDMW